MTLNSERRSNERLKPDFDEFGFVGLFRNFSVDSVSEALGYAQNKHEYYVEGLDE